VTETAIAPKAPPITAERAGWMLRMLLTIRLFEEQMLEFLNTGVIKGGSHLYIGQEAVAVGVCAALQPDDYITSTHRGHGHGLAKGGNPRELMAEILGKATGVCRGRGGSLHLADMNTGNLGANGIVGGSMGIAAGAALSCHMRRSGQIVACFFGDGAVNTGIFHESLNMAQVWKLPVLFVCENNLYGMSVSVKVACAVQDIAVRASSYNMPGEVVDGQTVLEVKAAVEKAAARARKGEGSTLLECKTYRYRGHSRSDPRNYRTKEEEQYWHERDPIALFSKHLVEQNILTQAEVDAVQKDVDQEMAAAEDFAINQSPYPDPSTLLEDVYAEWIEGTYGLEPIKK
jgi:pyruvate dehydrogenase E1 component alpha subunit